MAQGLGESEVDEFDLMRERVDHDILRFDISVHDAFRVEILQRLAELNHDRSDLLLVEASIVKISIVSVVLTQVHLKVLEHQVKGFVGSDEV